jgi:protein arginine N-methyltransferase 5
MADYHQSSIWDPSALLSTAFTLADLEKATKSFKGPKKEHYETSVLKITAEAQEKGYKRACIPLTTDQWRVRWQSMCLLPTESSEEDKEVAANAAETWRRSPAFKRDEVTITRLGVYCWAEF